MCAKHALRQFPRCKGIGLGVVFGPAERTESAVCLAHVGVVGIGIKHIADLMTRNACHSRCVPEAHQLPQWCFLQKFKGLATTVALAFSSRWLGLPSGPLLVIEFTPWMCRCRHLLLLCRLLEQAAIRMSIR